MIRLGVAAKIGQTALRIYCNHLIAYTAGVASGGIYVALILVARGVVQ